MLLLETGRETSQRSVLVLHMLGESSELLEVVEETLQRSALGEMVEEIFQRSVLLEMVE